MSRWQAIIGLEVHAQLRTRSKLFCPCPVSFGGEPNSRVCPVCLGHPGTLPVVNREAVRLGVRLALATGARLRPRSLWARKNYFYPDLAKGYQITQYQAPLAVGGAVAISGGGGEQPIPLRRIHLEEDAGASLHRETPDGGESWIDFNRAGTPLAEIVTEPVLRTPGDAARAVSSLRQLMQYLEICDGNMEEGSLRVDANVSIQRERGHPADTWVELKNLNSLRFLERGLVQEISRQTQLLEAGCHPVRQTRLYDPDADQTVEMRGKEEVEDYRYFPEPDLPPLVVDSAWVEGIRRDLPELPDARLRRFRSAYGLRVEDASTLTATTALAEFFEGVARVAPDAAEAALWVRGELVAHWRRVGVDPLSSPVSTVQVGRLLQLLRGGSLTGALAKQVLREMIDTGEDPDVVMARRGWSVARDPAELEVWIAEVLDRHPGEVESLLAGREALFHFFVGQVMRRSGGRADPQSLSNCLARTLEERRRTR